MARNANGAVSLRSVDRLPKGAIPFLLVPSQEATAMVDIQSPAYSLPALSPTHKLAHREIIECGRCSQVVQISTAKPPPHSKNMDLACCRCAHLHSTSPPAKPNAVDAHGVAGAYTNPPFPSPLAPIRQEPVLYYPQAEGGSYNRSYLRHLLTVRQSLRLPFCESGLPSSEYRAEMVEPRGDAGTSLGIAGYPSVCTLGMYESSEGRTSMWYSLIGKRRSGGQ